MSAYVLSRWGQCMRQGRRSMQQRCWLALHARASMLTVRRWARCLCGVGCRLLQEGRGSELLDLPPEFDAELQQFLREVTSLRGQQEGSVDLQYCLQLRWGGVWTSSLHPVDGCTQ